MKYYCLCKFKSDLEEEVLVGCYYDYGYEPNEEIEVMVHGTDEIFHKDEFDIVKDRLTVEDLVRGLC